MTRKEVENSLKEQIDALGYWDGNTDFAKAKRSIITIKLNVYTDLLAAYIKAENGKPGQAGTIHS